jgi:hypothetical protein
MGLGAVIYTAERLTDLRSRDSFTGYVFRREAVAACDVLLVLFCFAPNQVTVEWDSLLVRPRVFFFNL